MSANSLGQSSELRATMGFGVSTTLKKHRTLAANNMLGDRLGHESWKVAFAHLRVPSLPRNVIPVVTPLRRSHPSLHPVPPFHSKQSDSACSLAHPPNLESC